MCWALTIFSINLYQSSGTYNWNFEQDNLAKKLVEFCFGSGEDNFELMDRNNKLSTLTISDPGCFLGKHSKTSFLTSSKCLRKRSPNLRPDSPM